jgi:hypothetical protein
MIAGMERWAYNVQFLEKPSIGAEIIEDTAAQR